MKQKITVFSILFIVGLAVAPVVYGQDQNPSWWQQLKNFFSAANSPTSTPSPNTAGTNEDFANLNASTLTTINSSNVGTLAQKWHFPTKDPVSGKPILNNGKVYFADWGGYVYSLDQQTGQVIWQNQVETQVKKEWPWHGFAGSGMMGDNVLYFGSVEGNLYAINSNNGKVIWQVKVTNQPLGGMLAPPLYSNGMVYVGLESVNEPLSKKQPDTQLNFQGHVTAFHANDGSIAWDLPLVEQGNNGVPVWGGFALDTATNTLYFGTGNNYTGNSTKYSDSAMAVDATNGSVKWTHQAFANDVWVKDQPVGPDWDFSAAPQLFSAGGKQLVGFSSKSGIYFVLDRSNGNPEWQSVVGYGSVGGGMRWGASVGNNALFASSNNNYEDKNPADNPIDVKAFDTATGNMLWSKPKAQPAKGTNSDFLSNDVFLVGSLDGTLQAYNSTNGDVLKTIKVPAAIASSLAVQNDSIYIGAGVPSDFGGGSGNSGIYTYSLTK